MEEENGFSAPPNDKATKLKCINNLSREDFVTNLTSIYCVPTICQAKCRKINIAPALEEFTL